MAGMNLTVVEVNHSRIPKSEIEFITRLDIGNLNTIVTRRNASSHREQNNL